MPSELTFYDCFSGIGGFRLGLERAGFRCVGGCEISKPARQIYRQNFGEYPTHGDVTRVDARDIPDHDVLTAGFPCQAFSSAGKRLGFDDTRGTLFFEIARIAKQKRPRILLLENVKGLLFHDNKRTFTTILATLNELGYHAEWQVIDGKYFVPQKRERIFIVGHLGEKPTPEIFPILEGGEVDDGARRKAPRKRARLSDSYSHTIDSNYWRMRGSGRTMIAYYSGAHPTERVYSTQGLAPTLVASDGGGNRPQIAIPVLTVDRIRKWQHGRRLKTNGEPAFTLTTTDSQGIYDGMRIRRLTPLECERLMGMPDSWTRFGYALKGDTVWTGRYQKVRIEGVLRKKPVMMKAPEEGIYEMTDTARYMTIGNSVVVPAVEFLARRIMAAMTA